MKKFSAICAAAALALSGTGIAQAATFSANGKHTFQGSVEVKKNLGSWTNCVAELVIDVTGGVGTVDSMALTGSFPCGSITFSTPPFTIDAFGNPVTVLRINNVRTDIPMIPTMPPIPADACEGSILALWHGNLVVPRAIEFQDPLSDTPDADPDHTGATENNCKIKGILYQTDGPSDLTITP